MSLRPDICQVNCPKNSHYLQVAKSSTSDHLPEYVFPLFTQQYIMYSTYINPYIITYSTIYQSISIVKVA